jgi:hypothetical protein
LTDELRVDGRVTVYRVHDIGYVIALDRAAELLGSAPTSRVRPARLEARAIEIRNPPISVPLRSFDLMLDRDICPATVSAHLFDFGVCSLQVQVQAPSGLTWASFAEFGAAVERSPDLKSVFDETLGAITQRIAAAIERPAVAPLAEDYRVYRIDAIAGGSATSVLRTLSEEQLVSLLIGERRPLSNEARRELIPYRFSYYDDDLVVLTWESALIVEPRADDRDVEHILEFANAQLLELRMYDLQLDASLPALYDRVEATRARRRPRLASRFRAVLSDLQARVADVTETIERVENSLKVTNDVYLARIYAAALELFRERAWRSGIERKLTILRETYAMLNSEAQSARAELLEIAIVVLIVAELVLAVLRGSS